MYMDNVEKIISGNMQLAEFWSNSHGWAPSSAAELMSKSRLDWQVSLSRSLEKWSSIKESESGELILAWANLGVLVEGSMKLFLSVYLDDYSNDEDKYLDYKTNDQIDPDILAFEKLKQFFRRKELVDEKWFSFLDRVQQRRNAIHAFKDRPIGTAEEFYGDVENYLGFLRDINSGLPYPDEIMEPTF